MASLSDINQTLLGQNEILIDTRSRVERTNDILKKSLESQFRLLNMNKLKEGETKLEANNKSSGMLTKIGSSIKGAKDGTSRIFRNIGEMLTPAALAALPAILGRTLLTKGIPALAVGVFADEIASFLVGPETEKELRDQVAKAIQGGAIGSLFGKKFAVIGAAAGFIIDDEMKKKIVELAKSIGTLIGADVTSFEDIKGLMVTIGTFLRENLKKGLDGINNLLNGDIKKFFGMGEGPGGQGENQVLSTLGLLTSLGLLISPRGTIGAAILTAKALWGGAKLLSSITGLTALGNSLVGAAPPAAGAARGARSGPFGRAAGRMGLFASAGRAIAFMGPAGLVIAGAAGLTYLGMVAGDAFKTTDMYKDLLEKQKKREEESKAFKEAVQQRIDAGMSPEKAEAEVQALGIARSDGGFGQRSGKETIREYKGEVVGSQNFMTKLDQLEKLEPILIKQKNEAKLKELAERRAALKAFNDSKNTEPKSIITKRKVSSLPQELANSYGPDPAAAPIILAPSTSTSSTTNGFSLPGNAQSPVDASDMLLSH